MGEAYIGLHNEIVALGGLRMTQVLAPIVPPRLAPPDFSSDPVARRWTKDEFYQMADLGLFWVQKTELIDGEIMVMSPQKPIHYTVVDQAGDVLRDLVGTTAHVRLQGPMDLGPHSEPEPDIAVVKGKRKDYSTQHPRSALLLVEVSDSTLQSDRTRKASLFARAGITDYWIIDLVHNQVEVFRDPVPDATQPYGFGYKDINVYSSGMQITALNLSIVVDVAKLLP
jgi:Uma2 family endonuclease